MSCLYIFSIHFLILDTQMFVNEFSHKKLKIRVFIQRHILQVEKKRRGGLRNYLKYVLRQEEPQK